MIIVYYKENANGQKNAHTDQNLMCMCEKVMSIEKSLSDMNLAALKFFGFYALTCTFLLLICES